MILEHLHTRLNKWLESKNARKLYTGPIYSMLTDAGSGAVLAVSPHPSVITFLNEAFIDTNHLPGVWSAAYPSGLPFSSLDDSLAHWTWDTTHHSFNPTRVDLLTEVLQDRSRLAIAKQRAISQIILHINVSRNPLKTGLEFQESVYLGKKLQAEAFKATNYDEDRLFEFPYILEYADLTDISPREAVADILLKAKLAEDLLVKTETLRLTYFRRIKEAQDMGGVTRAFEEFLRDCYTNARV